MYLNSWLNWDDCLFPHFHAVFFSNRIDMLGKSKVKQYNKFMCLEKERLENSHFSQFHHKKMSEMAE